MTAKVSSGVARGDGAGDRPGVADGPGLPGDGPDDPGLGGGVFRSPRVQPVSRSRTARRSLQDRRPTHRSLRARFTSAERLRDLTSDVKVRGRKIWGPVMARDYPSIPVLSDSVTLEEARERRGPASAARPDQLLGWAGVEDAITHGEHSASSVLFRHEDQAGRQVKELADPAARI